MNKKIPFPIAIIIIIVCAAIVGGLAWQFRPILRKSLENKYCEQDSNCIFTQCCGCASSCKKICSEQPKALPCECINNQCVPKIAEDETANWKTYQNEEYGFGIKYPEEWISDGAKYSEKPNLFGAEVMGFVRFYPKDKRWINFIFDERVGVFPVGILLLEGSPQQFLSEVSEENKKEVLINNIPATQTKSVSKTGGEIYQYVFDVSGNDKFIAISNAVSELTARLKVLYNKTEFSEENEFQGIFNQMLSTFRFVKTEEIQTGKITIDNTDIEKLQKTVDEGHQPWRLDPSFVVRSEALQYGFTEDDLKTIYIPHMSSQWVSGRDITLVEAEITHNGEKYIITVSQPIPGELKIWTVTEIRLK